MTCGAWLDPNQVYNQTRLNIIMAHYGSCIWGCAQTPQNKSIPNANKLYPCVQTHAHESSPSSLLLPRTSASSRSVLPGWFLHRAGLGTQEHPSRRRCTWWCFVLQTWEWESENCLLPGSGLCCKLVFVCLAFNCNLHVIYFDLS